MDDDNVIERKPKIKPSNKTNHPTKFKHEYHELLIAHMAKGFSYESFAAITDTSTQTLYNWERTKPGWVETKAKAFAKCQYRWEEIGMTLSSNAALWMFQMKARFGWRDTVSVEQSVNLTTNDEKERSVEDIKSRYNEIIDERVRALATGPKDNL